MTIRTRMILIFGLLIVLVVILSMVKKRKLELKFVLGWLGCDIALILMTCFPGLLGVFTEMLGMRSAMNMIFFMGFVFCLLLIFSLTVAMSRVSEKVRRIAQVIALLPDDIKDDIYKKIEEEKRMNK